MPLDDGAAARSDHEPPVHNGIEKILIFTRSVALHAPGMKIIPLSPALHFLCRACVAVVMAALPTACGGTIEIADSSAASSGSGSGGGGAGGGGTSSATTGSGATPLGAFVRVAHLSSQLAPFDLCGGATSDEPLLAAAGLAGGLEFGQVSRYLTGVPLASSLKLVPAGASCADPAGVSLTIPWPKGFDSSDARLTIVPFRTVTDEIDELAAYAYLDEPINDGFGINLRALNFLQINQVSELKPALDLAHRSLGGQGWDELFTTLEFAAVPSVSPVGAVTEAGFVHTPYVAVGALRAVALLEGGQLETTEDVAIPGGMNAYGVGSIFAAGAFFTVPARLIVCADNAPPDGALSRCEVLLSPQ